MQQFVSLLERNVQDSIAAKQQFLLSRADIQVFAQAAAMLVQAYQQGGRLYIAGNGGSAADAQHLAAEFVSKLARDRAPLAAEALTVDSSVLTAIGNDYGYDQLFARQVAGKMRTGDVFLGITTSGQSANILNALRECRARALSTIVFSGRGGGTARELADYCICASGNTTAAIQELHIVLAHSLCESVERALFPQT